MKIMTYSFRTFPFLPNLKNIFGEVFVFGKLKADFGNFSEKILAEKPDYIIGIARSRHKSSLESVTVNRIGQGVIDKDGPDGLQLFVPKNFIFAVPTRPTTAFCNWTMYKIASFIKKENLESKLLFVHINEKDLDKLSLLRESLTDENRSNI